MSQPLITHILFPTDLSPASLRFAPQVKALVQRHLARLTLIHVVSPGPETRVRAHPSVDGLKRAFDPEFAELCSDVVIDSGDPVDVITQFIHIYGVDLVMMPTHGHRPFHASSLGSVSVGVLNSALCPVWTAKHAEPQPFNQPFACQNVLCAIDATPKSTPVIDWAARFCRDRGAKLRLVHVIRESASEKKASAAIEILQRTTGVRAPVSICVGEVHEEVRAEAGRHNADSLVIGRGLSLETGERLGGHSKAIIQHAPCPVVSV